MKDNRLRVAVLSGRPVVLAGLVSLLCERADEVEIVTSADVRKIGANPVGAGSAGGAVDAVVYDIDDSARSSRALRDFLSADLIVVGIRSDRRADLNYRAQSMGINRIIALSASVDELVGALHSAGDDIRVPQSQVEPNLPGLLPGLLPGPLPGPLSQRELQMLAMIATGKSNHQIARELHLSINTIKTHVRHTYAKLGVNTRTGAALWYLQGPGRDLGETAGETDIGS